LDFFAAVAVMQQDAAVLSTSGSPIASHQAISIPFFKSGRTDASD
jgi:hypothetical protein